jgi:hypothetical protein
VMPRQVLCHLLTTISVPSKVLDTVISGTQTCRSRIELYKTVYDELNSCYFTALDYPQQCGICHSFASPCNVFMSATASPQAAPIVSSTSTLPIKPRQCARIAKTRCGCHGSLKCKQRVVRLKCFPPDDPLERKAYFKSVLSGLDRACSSRK